MSRNTSRILSLPASQATVHLIMGIVASYEMFITASSSQHGSPDLLSWRALLCEREASCKAHIFHFPPPSWRAWPLLWLREHRVDFALLCALSALPLLLVLLGMCTLWQFIGMKAGVIIAFHFLEKHLALAFAEHWLLTGERVPITPQQQGGLEFTAAEMNVIARVQHQGMVGIVASGKEHYHGYPYMKEYNTAVWCWVLFCSHHLAQVLIALNRFWGMHVPVIVPTHRQQNQTSAFRIALHFVVVTTRRCLPWMATFLHTSLPVLAGFLCMWTMVAFVLLSPPDAGNAGIGCALSYRHCPGMLPVLHGAVSWKDPTLSFNAAAPVPDSEYLSWQLQSSATSCWHRCGVGCNHSLGTQTPANPPRHERNGTTSSEVSAAAVPSAVASPPPTLGAWRQRYCREGCNAGQEHGVACASPWYVYVLVRLRAVYLHRVAHTCGSCPPSSPDDCIPLLSNTVPCLRVQLVCGVVACEEECGHVNSRRNRSTPWCTRTIRTTPLRRPSPLWRVLQQLLDLLLSVQCSINIAIGNQPARGVLLAVLCLRSLLQDCVLALPKPGTLPTHLWCIRDSRCGVVNPPHTVGIDTLGECGVPLWWWTCGSNGNDIWKTDETKE